MEDMKCRNYLTNTATIIPSPSSNSTSSELRNDSIGMSKPHASTKYKGWYTLPLPKLPPFKNGTYMNCELTFTSGQCFGWHRDTGDDEIYTGVVDNQYVLSVRSEKNNVLYKVHLPRDLDSQGQYHAGERLAELLHYDINFSKLTQEWSQADTRMSAIADALPGLRILRQDPIECLFSFICSSNNNIKRITGMLQALRQQYGTLLGTVCGTEYYSFPSVDVLATAKETELRKLGLGYRAKYILQTAKFLNDNGGTKWLKDLRQQPRDIVMENLIQLSGVGWKVADCVALFSLDKADAIPVDTHVWAIACRDFDNSLRLTKSLTPTVYERVGDLFRAKYGVYAGWAHSLLFAAELPRFRSMLPLDLQNEMLRFAVEEKNVRSAQKAEKKAKNASTKSTDTSLNHSKRQKRQK